MSQLNLQLLCPSLYATRQASDARVSIVGGRYSGQNGVFHGRYDGHACIVAWVNLDREATLGRLRMIHFKNLRFDNKDDLNDQIRAMHGPPGFSLAEMFSNSPEPSWSGNDNDMPPGDLFAVTPPYHTADDDSSSGSNN